MIKANCNKEDIRAQSDADIHRRLALRVLHWEEMEGN